MRYVPVLLLVFAASCPAHAARGCPVTEQKLTGAWGRAGNAGFFEEFVLEIDSGTRTFNSWLHHRPDIFGATWAFKGCSLVVTSQRGEFDPFRFKVISLKQGKLHLKDESDHTESVYWRLPDKP
jgi:hypothetical protein